MDIREADIVAMDRAELEELIDCAVHPDVPLRVLFAALDRYTALQRPVLDDEPAPGAEPETASGVASVVASVPTSVTTSPTAAIAIPVGMNPRVRPDGRGHRA